MLPVVVLCRLDCVLEPIKDAVWPRMRGCFFASVLWMIPRSLLTWRRVVSGEGLGGVTCTVWPSSLWKAWRGR